ALTRIQAFAAVHQRQIDEEEAARLLSDIIPAGTRKPINVDRIQALVADYYNVTLDDMKGKRRDKHIVFPRQVAMYLVREETPSSLPAIGKALGGRDHTTALHSIEKIDNDLDIHSSHSAYCYRLRMTSIKRISFNGGQLS